MATYSQKHDIVLGYPNGNQEVVYLDIADSVYEIQSGKPAGEIRHRAIFAARTIEEAEACKAAIVALSERWPGERESENWLWGPHIFERDYHPKNEDDSAPAEFWYDYCAEREASA